MRRPSLIDRLLPAGLERRGALRVRYRGVVVNALGFLLIQSFALLCYALIGGLRPPPEQLLVAWFTAGPLLGLIVLRTTASIGATILVTQTFALLGLLAWCCLTGGVRSPFVPILLITPAQAFAYQGTRGVGLAFAVCLALLAALAAGSALGLWPPSLLPTEVPIGFHLVGLIYPLVLLSVLSWLAERARAEIRARLVEARDTAEQIARELTASRAAVAGHAARAEAASRAKSAFVAYLTHEIRTPIGAILGYTELLEESMSDADGAHLADLRRIRGVTRHLLSLVNNVLDLSKIEAGKMELAPAPVEPAALVADVVDACEHLITRNGNRLTVVAPEARGPVVIDRLKTTQVLVNLLANAGKFTRDGEVVLRLARDGDGPAARLRVDVTDTGIGMTAEQLGRAFDDFTQATAETAATYGGTGLGLPLARRLCALMGGELRLSSAPGRGTTAIVTLPAPTVTTGAAPP